MYPEFPTTEEAVVNQETKIEAAEKLRREVNNHTKAREMKRKGEIPANNPPNGLNRFTIYEEKMKGKRHRSNNGSNNESNNY